MSLHLYGLAVAALVLSFAVPAMGEQDLTVYTSEETYYYGDHLTFTMVVPEVTGEMATMYIIDQDSKSSSPIPLGVAQANTTLTSPFPFEAQVYPQGTYTIRVLYSGGEASAQFTLADSDRIVIPSWIKDVARLWTDGLIDDAAFAGAVRVMADGDILSIPAGAAPEADSVVIPGWVQSTALWWADGRITDEDFARELQFLIDERIALV